MSRSRSCRGFFIFLVSLARTSKSRFSKSFRATSKLCSCAANSYFISQGGGRALKNIPAKAFLLMVTLLAESESAAIARRTSSSSCHESAPSLNVSHKFCVTTTESVEDVVPEELVRPFPVSEGPDGSSKSEEDSKSSNSVAERLGDLCTRWHCTAIAVQQYN